MQSPTSSFETYRDAAVDTLAVKFPTTVVKTRLQMEWMGFKHILISKLAEVRPEKVMATISADSFSLFCLTLSKLASISLTVPNCIADCKKGFLTMNRIK